MYRTQLDHSDPLEPTVDHVYWGLTGDTLSGGDNTPARCVSRMLHPLLTGPAVYKTGSSMT